MVAANNEELKDLIEVTKTNMKLSQVGEKNLLEKRKLAVGWKKTAFEAESRIRDKDTRSKIENELRCIIPLN